MSTSPGSPKSPRANDEVVELTLCQIPECFAFKLPPRVQARGWLAAQMTEQVWTGRLKIVQRAKEAAIFLLNKDDGKVFAMCPLNENAVERCSDSSRYFSLKIQNPQGRHAFIGLAFNDRNQAFDFNVAMQEFTKDLDRTKALEDGGSDAPGGAAAAASGPAKDYSLKEGQKITVSIAGSASAGRKKERQRGTSGGGNFLAPPPGDTPSRKGGGGGLLAPPPADSAGGRRPKAGTGGGGGSLLDDDGAFSSGATAPASPVHSAWPGEEFSSASGGSAAAFPPASASAGDGFMDFASAPPPQPQQPPQQQQFQPFQSGGASPPRSQQPQQPSQPQPAANDMFAFMAAPTLTPASPPKAQTSLPQLAAPPQQQQSSPLFDMGSMGSALPQAAFMQPQQQQQQRPMNAMPGFPQQQQQLPQQGVMGGSNAMGMGKPQQMPSNGAFGGAFPPPAPAQQQKPQASDDPFGGLF